MVFMLNFALCATDFKWFYGLTAQFLNKSFQEITSLSIVLSLFIPSFSSIAGLQHLFCEDVGEFYRIFTFRFSFWPKNWPDLKLLFTFRNCLLGVKSTFLLHLNSQNVSLVLRCKSFDAVTVLTAFVLFNQSHHLAHSNMF